MSDHNPSDIPATLYFKEALKKLQDEFIVAIQTGEYPDKDYITFELDFNLKVDNIYLYLDKLYKLLLDVQEKYDVSIFTNKRLRELHLDAIFRTHHLYQN
nr:hypothetical protein [uncultured Flavobacterium sp.]